MSTLPTSPPAGQVVDHNRYAEHFFKGVCICPCPECTRKAPQADGDRPYGVLCLCPQCPEAGCGCKTKPAVG